MRTGDRGLVVGLYRSAPDRELIQAALELGIDHVDTAFNYSGGASHRLLRAQAGPLVSRLRISTKVGYFPGPGHARHDLCPRALEQAVGVAVTDLGTEPEVVLLHNPEASLTGLDPPEGAERLGQACQALRRARDAGLCRGWGISSWTPSRLLPYLGNAVLEPEPAVVMVRCGLTVPGAELVAARRLTQAFGVHTEQVWGMSPFGGRPRDPVWNPRVTAPFHPDTGAAPLQVALRVAFEVPGAARVAVGASSARQLRELHAGAALPIRKDVVGDYLRLICPE